MYAEQVREGGGRGLLQGKNFPEVSEKINEKHQLR